MDHYRQHARPSRRGLANLQPNPMFDLEREKETYPAYHPIYCPGGLIDISSAENSLMVDDLRDWAKEREETVFCDAIDTLGYGATAGSESLRVAIARYTTKYFTPGQHISPDSIIVGNGVSSLLSTLAYNICDPNEAIMLEVPNYGMFGSDLTYQNGIQLVRVDTDHIKDRFSSSYASSLLDTYEDAFQKATKSGTKIRAVLICNPCNPVGRCYSRETLVKIAQFCSKYNLHLVSDEIYALSARKSNDGLDGFTSALSLHGQKGVSFNNVQILSGASKDFGLGGLRLGWIITHNELLWQTVRRLTTVTWVTSFSDRLFASLLSDSQFMAEYARKLHCRLDQFCGIATGFLEKMDIPYARSNAGVFLWIDLSKWVSMIQSSDAVSPLTDPEMELARYLMGKGVYLQPGAAFFAPGKGRYRLVYTVNSQAVFATALSKLEGALLELSGTQSGPVTKRYSNASLDTSQSLKAVNGAETVSKQKHGKALLKQAMKLFCCGS